MADGSGALGPNPSLLRMFMGGLYEDEDEDDATSRGLRGEAGSRRGSLERERKGLRREGGAEGLERQEETRSRGEDAEEDGEADEAAALETEASIVVVKPGGRVTCGA